MHSAVVIEQKPFSNIQHFNSPLNQTTMFSRADTIYRSLNNNDIMYKNTGNHETRIAQSGLRYSYQEAQQPKEENPRELTKNRTKASMMIRSDTMDFYEPRDSNGEVFKSKTPNKYAHVRSKVDSNLHRFDNHHHRDKKYRSEERNMKETQQANNMEEDRRVTNGTVWLVTPMENIDNTNQRMRSFSASPNVTKCTGPTKSDNLPSRSRSASVHDFNGGVKIDSLYPSDFDSYVRQSETFTNSNNLANSLRFYRKYIRNKKHLESTHEQYNSTYDQPVQDNNGNTPVTFLHKQPTSESLLQKEHRFERKREPSFILNLPVVPTNIQGINNTNTTNAPSTTTSSNNNYHSLINQQYQNYLKAKQQYFKRSNTDITIKRNNNVHSQSTQFQPSTSTYHDYQLIKEKQHDSNHDFTTQQPTTKALHPTFQKTAYHEHQFVKNKETVLNDQYQTQRTMNILDTYLQQTNSVPDNNNKTLFEFPSFGNKQDLSSSWHGGAEQTESSRNQQDFTRSRSSSHGSQTIPQLNNTNDNNNLSTSTSEQLKMIRNLSIGKSLPIIPLKNVEQLPPAVKYGECMSRESKTYKSNDILPELKSSNNRLEQSLLLSMSLPAYLNYSDGILTKQSKHRPTLPIQKKKKKQVRIALEYNRVHVYTPEYF